jgi:hypothetical protein
VESAYSSSLAEEKRLRSLLLSTAARDFPTLAALITASSDPWAAQLDYSGGHRVDQTLITDVTVKELPNVPLKP